MTPYLPLVVLALAGAALFFWKHRGLASAEQSLAELHKGARVIDVRGPEEFASGHLPGAINLPLNELRAQISRHAPDKGTPLLLHCRSGVRSGLGKRILQRLGYTTVLNLGSYARAEKILRQCPAPQTSSSSSLPC